MQVHGSKIALPRCARHDMIETYFRVILHIAGFKSSKGIVNQLAHLAADRAIHQPLTRPVNQLPAFAQDVEGRQNSHHRIQPLPARQHHQPDAAHHANGCINIGAQMLAIGFQRDRVIQLGSPKQYPRHQTVENRAEH